MELFHQTVSMKSVGNLNDFVRTHMLEPFDAADWTNRLVDHFDDLTQAHEAVLKARTQLTLLEPLLADCDTYDELDAADHRGKAVGRLAVLLRGPKAMLLNDRLTAIAGQSVRSNEPCRGEGRPGAAGPQGTGSRDPACAAAVATGSASSRWRSAPRRRNAPGGRSEPSGITRPGSAGLPAVATGAVHARQRWREGGA